MDHNVIIKFRDFTWTSTSAASEESRKSKLLIAKSLIRKYFIIDSDFLYNSYVWLNKNITSYQNNSYLTLEEFDECINWRSTSIQTPKWQINPNIITAESTNCELFENCRYTFIILFSYEIKFLNELDRTHYLLMFPKTFVDYKI